MLKRLWLAIVLFSCAAQLGAVERFPGLRLMRPSWPLFDVQCSTSAITCGGGVAAGGNTTFTGNNTFTGTNTFSGTTIVQDGSKFQIQNQADATKVLRFSISGLATATTQQWNINGTASATALNIGFGASANSVVLGPSAAAITATSAVSIGNNPAVTGNDGIGIGRNIACSGAFSMCIGGLSSITGGATATVFGGDTTAVSNDVLWGSNNIFMATWYIGAGKTARAAPPAIVFQGTPTTGTNIAGPDYTLQPSLGTGNSVPGHQYLDQGAFSPTSGTTLQTPVHHEIFGHWKSLTNNTVTTIANVTVASNTVAAGFIRYSCQVFNGTDLQLVTGESQFSVTNKAGTIANNVVDTPTHVQNPVTSGTLTAVVTLTAANPALLQINCNSSLTPNAGYPIMGYDLQNMGNQAIVVQ